MRVVKRTVSPAVLAALLAALTVLCTTGVSPVHELGRAVGAASQPDRDGIAPGPAHVDRDVSTTVPVLRTVVRAGHAGGTTPYPGSALLPGAAALLVTLLALGLAVRPPRLPSGLASHGVPPGRAPPFASGT